MLSNETKGMLTDERIATCGEQSHLDTEYAWNAISLSSDDAGHITKKTDQGGASQGHLVTNAWDDEVSWYVVEIRLMRSSMVLICDGEGRLHSHLHR